MKYRLSVILEGKAFGFWPIKVTPIDIPLSAAQFNALVSQALPTQIATAPIRVGAFDGHIDLALRAVGVS